jgi:hypothetical protein
LDSPQVSVPVSKQDSTAPPQQPDNEPAIVLEDGPRYDPTVQKYDIPLGYELQEQTYYTCEKYDSTKYYQLMLAVMWQESNFTIDRVSPTQDYGLMQINRGNHAYLREQLDIVDFLDPFQNIDAGVYVLAGYIAKYEDIQKALMAYNMGQAGARKQWDKGIYTSAYSRAVIEKLELLDSLKIQK